MINTTLIAAITILAIGFFMIFLFSMPLYHLALKAQHKALQLQKKYQERDNQVKVILEDSK